MIKLRNLQINMQKRGERKAEVSFISESGREVKTIMTDNDINNEYDKLKNSIKKPWEIESESALRDIINLIEKNPNDLFIAYMMYLIHI